MNVSDFTLSKMTILGGKYIEARQYSLGSAETHKEARNRRDSDCSNSNYF